MSPQNPSATRVIPAKELVSSFATGRSFIETAQYRFGTARREGPGDVEIHAADTDIFYVVEGSAELVTGGRMTEPRTVGPNETRGSRIEGGESRTVGAGDVIVIPNGVAHWFKDVLEAPFIYLVVKSTAP